MAIYLTKRSGNGSNNAVQTTVNAGASSIIHTSQISFGRRGSVLIDIVDIGGTTSFSFVVYFIIDSTGLTYSEKDYIGDNINIDTTLAFVGGNIEVTLLNSETFNINVFSKLI